MKAVLPLADLARICRAAGRAVGPALARPVLGGIHLALHNGRLTATGTDLDLTISAGCDVDGGDPGAVVVPAKHLIKMLGRLSATGYDEAAIDATGDQLSITAGPIDFDLLVLPAQDWPGAPAVEGDAQEIDDGSWKLVRRIATAASTDHQRPIMTAVHLGPGRAEATDSYRAYVAHAPDGLDALIPARAIVETAQLLDGPVSITTDHNHARLATADVSVITRLIAGDYYPLDRLVEVERPHTLHIDGGELAAAILVLEGVQAEKGDPLAVILDITAEAVTVRRSSSKSNATAVVACTASAEMRLRANPAYLIDALDLIAPDGGQVAIEYRELASSLLMRRDEVIAVVALVHPPTEES